MNQRGILFEVNGTWLYRNQRLGLGSEIELDNMTWKVVGFGRSPNSQAPFLWLCHASRGTIVYAPALLTGAVMTAA